LTENPTANRNPDRPREPDPQQLARAQRIVDAALERKAERPVALDVRAISSFADTFVIVTGRSDRQVRAIAEHIAEVTRGGGERPIGIEGREEGHWVLMDYGDLIVHVFDPETRDHYDLERLWSDAPALPLSHAEGASDVRESSA
jgi:ribosome-associated protein